MRSAAGLAGACILALPAAGALHAQGTCRPGGDSNEGRTLATMSLPVEFSIAGLPGPLPAWRFRAGLEFAYVPNVDSVDAIPTTCRPGKDAEHVNLVDVAVRPRLEVGLPGRVVVELGWIPPLALSGVEANVVGVAVQWWPKLGGSPVALAVRAHVASGTIRAAITCPAEALEDPSSECYLGEESSDRFEPAIAGLEVAAAPTDAAATLAPHASVGVAWLSPAFQVDFTNQVGARDTTRVEVELTQVTARAGVTWRPRSPLAVSAEADALLGTGVTARVAVRWRFGS